MLTDQSSSRAAVTGLDRFENAEMLRDRFVDSRVIEVPRQRQRQPKSQSQRLVDVQQLPIPRRAAEVEMETGASLVDLFQTGIVLPYRYTSLQVKKNGVANHSARIHGPALID